MLMVNDGCRRSVVVTEGLWLSQRVWLSQWVCGCHRGSVVVTVGLCLSQRICGCHGGSVVVTEGLWLSQRVEGLWLSQRVMGAMDM